jgi:tRNA (guanine37-N1)-methyltransferase
MKFDVITIFPEIFNGFLKESILGKAQEKKAISIKIHPLRKWGEGKHETVDDIPYGGGPGMVIKVEPIFKAVKAIKKKGKKVRVVHLSPRGKTFNTKMAKRFAKYDQLILICGRYEGVDERVSKKIADETISVGNYITIGGEVPAMAVIEATSRYISGVIGKRESVQKDDYPQYTRPEIFSPDSKIKWKVPKVLISGDHKKIKEWRDKYEKEIG